MASKFTPGPWVVESADWPDDEPGVVRYYVRHTPPEIAMPNAHLIAAAPELYEACLKTIEENLHLADGDDCTLIHLKRALAKAEGK